MSHIHTDKITISLHKNNPSHNIIYQKQMLSAIKKHMLFIDESTGLKNASILLGMSISNKQKLNFLQVPNQVKCN